VRWRALQSLHKLKPRGASKEIQPLLQDPSPRVRGEAATALGKIGDRDLVPSLHPLIQDDSSEVRWKALEAIAEIGMAEEFVLEKILLCLEDPESSVRMQAARALGTCKYQPAATLLIEKLRDPKHTVRWFAAWALGHLGDEKAIQPLIKSLGDGDEYVRIYVYQALSEFGPRAKTALLEALSDPDPTIKRLVKTLLEDISYESERKR
jgi:HEAT repeat protein